MRIRKRFTLKKQITERMYINDMRFSTKVVKHRNTDLVLIPNRIVKKYNLKAGNLVNFEIEKKKTPSKIKKHIIGRKANLGKFKKWKISPLRSSDASDWPLGLLWIVPGNRPWVDTKNPHKSLRPLAQTFRRPIVCAVNFDDIVRAHTSPDRDFP